MKLFVGLPFHSKRRLIYLQWRFKKNKNFFEIMVLYTIQLSKKYNFIASLHSIFYITNILYNWLDFK
jgi:hypothetical protein